MSYDISAIGLSARLVADKTFPTGFTITAWADDADPFDIPEIDIAEAAMNVNGDLIVFSSPNPIPITINVIPDSEDDENLSALLEANRAGKNKMHAGDTITIVANYASGASLTLSDGKLLSGAPATSPSSGGRMKSKAYSFAFQNLARTRA